MWFVSAIMALNINELKLLSKMNSTEVSMTQIETSMETDTGELKITRLLKIEEVAEITKISTSHLYALINERVLPAVQFGRAKRIRPEDLEEFIRSNLTVSES
jgi:excisionase family DNA binding protein